MFNKDLKCGFIHIPKCAGTSINQTFKLNPFGFSGHAPLSEHQELIEKGYFFFTAIRNPWDRVVSLYHYFHQMKEGHRWYKNNKDVADLVGKIDFDEFLNCLYDLECHAYSGIHFRSFDYFLAGSDKIQDKFYILRVEDLEAGIAEVCKRLSIPNVFIKKVNKSKRSLYKDYYKNDNQINKVYEFYKSDINKFKYGYE